MGLFKKKKKEPEKRMGVSAYDATSVIPAKEQIDMLEKATLREHDELLDFQDLVHRYDWACIESRIKKMELSMLNEEIVREWHYALNWLTGVEGVTDWDEVPIKA